MPYKIKNLFKNAHVIMYSMGIFNIMLAGSLWYAWQHELIIIRSPYICHTENTIIQAQQERHSPIHIFFWLDNNWHQKDVPLQQSPANPTHNLHTVISAWLDLLIEEHLISEGVALESVAISHDGAAFISFNRAIVPTQAALIDKWLMIEGFLKTIARNVETVQNVYLFVQHKPMIDCHLDLSNPWPVQGYIHDQVKKLSR